jgi:hypothetical protein
VNIERCSKRIRRMPNASRTFNAARVLPKRRTGKVSHHTRADTVYTVTTKGEQMIGVSKEVEQQLAAYPRDVVDAWFSRFSSLGEIRLRYARNREATDVTS